MHRLAGEGTREVGQPRVPVMPVGDDQQVEVALRARLVDQAPPAVGIGFGVHDTVFELDVVGQPEGLGVVVEVGLDLRVVRKRRVMLGHRKVLERQAMLRGVDVQRPVGAAMPVGIRECPVPPDAVGGLERGVGDAVVLEHLAGRQTADPRADHCDLLVCLIHRRSSRRHAIYERF